MGQRGNDAPECFARDREWCTVLDAPRCVYFSNDPGKGCAFCKPEREVTDGKRFPWDKKQYSERLKEG